MNPAEGTAGATVSAIMSSSHAVRTAVRVGLDYRPALLSRAGIARSVRELAVGLERIDEVDCRLFGHSLARCRVEPAHARGLQRLPIPGRTLPALSRLGLGADRLCGGTDVFHWTDYVYPPVSRARVVVTVHDVSFAEDPEFHGATQSDVLLARCRAAADRVDRVLTPTQATADAAERHLGIAREKLTVVPFGSDHVLRESPPPHPRGGRPFLLALGTIEPRKNHLRLLEAWRALPTPRPELVVIGRPGWECERTVAALNRARADGGVTWLDDADDATMLAHLAHATALAYPSLLEGFGFPPLEALALGTPVVAGDTPALREVCDDAAAYCDPRDVESIRDALRDVVDGKDVADRVALGRERARSFRWSECAATHARVYAEVAS